MGSKFNVEIFAGGYVSRGHSQGGPLWTERCNCAVRKLSCWPLLSKRISDPNIHYTEPIRKISHKTVRTKPDEKHAFQLVFSSAKIYDISSQTKNHSPVDLQIIVFKTFFENYSNCASYCLHFRALLIGQVS